MLERRGVEVPIVSHDKSEMNGWHHKCARDPTHEHNCRCICTHTVDEFDPLHVHNFGREKIEEMLRLGETANAAA